jgi:hypothetical protein
MDVLKPDNYQDKINSYSKADWAPLLDLIPEIEKTEKFDETPDIELIAEEEYLVPNCVVNEIVDRFQHIVYAMPIIIDFDWPGWNEGRNIASNKNFDFNTIDIPTNCKLITAFVRNDRFCEGVLAGAFEEGIILKILKSIRNQLVA